MLMMKNDDRVIEWEEGLPAPEELTPLSQSLISEELASAFSISVERFRSSADVLRASQSAFTSLRRTSSFPIPSSLRAPVLFPSESPFRAGAAFACTQDSQRGGNVGDRCAPAIGSEFALSKREDQDSLQNSQQRLQAVGIPVGCLSQMTGQLGITSCYNQDIAVLNESLYTEKRPDSDSVLNAGRAATDSGDIACKKPRKQSEEEQEEADSGPVPENSNEEQAARTLKRPRLVWTPQLHKRFVDAVAHLGIKNAVPKTIMQLMNVEGLTRENVASHLQKYRLYLKRMQGFSNDGPSASDQLFASTPIPACLAASAHFVTGFRDDVLPMAFAAPVVPVPFSGLSHGHIPGHIGHFQGFDPHAYKHLVRTPATTVAFGHQRDLVTDNQNQPGSPPGQILTLFPTG